VDKIVSFRGGYSFLSNFAHFEKPLQSKGIVYRSNEHFYQAMKVTDHNLRKSVAEHPTKGLKKYIRTLQWRDDFDEIKYDVMLYGLRYKFSLHNPNLRSRLRATGDAIIEEGNWWGDKYWGVCLKTCEGQNKLGKMLMLVREEITGE
jgi:N-glycosidase YbiA